jgi:hypothetical protein
MKTDITKCVSFGHEEDFKAIQEYYLKLKAETKKLTFSHFVRDCIEKCILNDKV